MTDPIHADLLRELVAIQRARALNWRNPTTPLDARLEASHAARLAAIKKHFSALRVEDSEKSPADAPTCPNRGVSAASAGNILRRMFRRFRKAKH